MDPQDSTQIESPKPTPNPTPPQPQTFLSRLKNLSKKKKTIIGTTILIFIALTSFLFLKSTNIVNNLNKSNQTINKESSFNLPSNMIAKVGETLIPKTFLDREIEYYPTTPTAEVKKTLIDKIIDDQLTIQYGVSEGIIDDIYSAENQTKEEYLKRISAVQQVINHINNSSSNISGKLVSVWFYNNRYIGPLGLEKGKEIAYSKIKPLYDQVKNKTISIDQAGKTLAADTSLKSIDPSYEVNAFSSFKWPKEKQRLTFWPKFDEMIRQTPVGEVTPLYLGQDTDDNGQPIDQLYVFVQVDSKIIDKEYGDYDSWLKKQRENLSINYDEQKTTSLLDGLIPLAFADDDSPNCMGRACGHGGVPSEWNGKVTTPTGAPIVGAQVVQTSSCSPGGRTATTDSQGRYGFGESESFSCGCNPIVTKVTYNGRSCGQTTTMIPNGYLEAFGDNVICQPEPPVNRCGQACTGRADCENAKDECSYCLPNTDGSAGMSCQKQPKCGDECVSDLSCAEALNGCTKCLPDPANPNKKTCQTPPPPISCGSACTTNIDCKDESNQGCTSCVPNPNGSSGNICAKPPQCGTACVDSRSCADAKDGCTNCIKEASGSAVCGKCPVGMNYDPTQQKCVCPNPGETNPHGVCDGDKCTQVGSCGITECTTDKQCFAEEMCKCDGFEAVTLEYPSTKPFTFNAFAKVEGTDIRRAVVEGIRFKISESDKSNPNAGTIIAQSPMFTPEIVSSSSAKVRFKATWNLTPPQIKANKVYRVFSEIKCAPKKKRSTTANANDPKQFQSKVAGISTAQAQEPGGDDLQLRTLNFIKKGQTDNCRFLFFEYDQGL